MEPDSDNIKDEDMDEADDADGSDMEGMSDDNGDGEGAEIREMKHRLEKFGWPSEWLWGFKFWLWHTSKRTHYKVSVGGFLFVCFAGLVMACSGNPRGELQVFASEENR